MWTWTSIRFILMILRLDWRRVYRWFMMRRNGKMWRKLFRILIRVVGSLWTIMRVLEAILLRGLASHCLSKGKMSVILADATLLWSIRSLTSSSIHLLLRLKGILNIISPSPSTHPTSPTILFLFNSSTPPVKWDQAITRELKSDQAA